MAESVGLYFTATQQEVAATVDGLAQRIPRTDSGGQDEWAYPPGAESNTIVIYPYDAPLNLLDELEPDQVERLVGTLGARPTTCWSIELRGSAGRRAVDDAVEVTLQLLRAHDGVADDSYASEFWRRDDIEAGGTGGRPSFLGPLRDRLSPR